MTNDDDEQDFYVRYAAALRAYVVARGEASLAIGHELGRQALLERLSMLDIIENHFRLVDDLARHTRVDGSAALEFLLQTLATLDIATRGFLDGTRRYEQQRAQYKVLADRDEFRTALVNSLQEGFFVADHDGVIVEINDAFAEITGYGPDGVPYAWPHPWVIDEADARGRISRLVAEGHIEYEAPIRHREGHVAWVATSINAVTAKGADRNVYVGTVRDVTAARAASARETAVTRLATAVSVAKSVGEVLSVMLDECRDALDVQRVVAVMWPTGDDDPTVQAAGVAADLAWHDLDPFLRETLDEARNRLPVTVEPVASADDAGRSRGILAVLSGDVTLWLEYGEPRPFSTQERLLAIALVGHFGLAMQHVRQFEIARETSLTLQRAMLTPTKPPAGFAVRYEPAVLPLEIGGDWYDVLPVDERRIAIIVGDCVGRGLPAAAVMGQLRSSARALLLTGAEPAVLVEQLDSAAALIPDAYCSTVFLAILDTESGMLRYTSAGHVPAVVVTAGSEAVMLDDAVSVPLAVQRDHPRPQGCHALMPESTLMLFTDGLVERRQEPIDDVIARVAEILTKTMDLPIDTVADVVLREMAPASGYDDDVAIVICRPLSPFRIENYATADRLAYIRHRLGAWLRAAGISDRLAADVVLVVNEACTNSVEHAYWQRERLNVRVEADIENSEIRVRVADSGSWKTPAAEPGNRGRGLPLIRSVSERVELDRSPAGTTIEMSFRVPGSQGPTSSG
jgi:PAS domain S-box-containing protein